MSFCLSVSVSCTLSFISLTPSLVIYRSLSLFLPSPRLPLATFCSKLPVPKLSSSGLHIKMDRYCLLSTQRHYFPLSSPLPPPLQRLCNDILWTLALPPSHAFIYFRFFPHPALFQVYIVGFVYYETFPDGLLNGPPSTTLSPARLGVYFFCIALLPLPVATESLACHLRARSEHRLIMPFWTEMFGNTTRSVWSPYSCLSDPYVTVQGGNHQRRASILEFLSMLAS